MSNPLEHLDDQYEVLSRMHEGGMGAIYKVRHRFLEQIRVVKVLHSRLREEGEFQERFQREARLATKVRHPNIAEVYDFSVKKGTAFLIMEFIEGVNFGQLLESGGPPKIETTLEISIQALNALGHIHQRDLVHRDISPDNLMLTKDDLGRPLVKLIDLGIVKPLAEDTTLTKTGLFMGKLHYASPEQFGQTEKGVKLDQRSDLYSFGIVLYQLLTGEVPYSGSESAVIAGHLFHPPKDFERADPDHRIPSSLRDIVLKGLQKNPSDRHQTAREFAAALEAELSGKPPLPTRPAPGSSDVTEIAPTAAAAKHSEALLSGAERLAQLEQFDEARAQLETLLALDPHFKKAQQLLRRVCDTQLAPLLGEASRYLISESFEQAVERLNKAMAIDPKNESVIRLLNDAKAGLHAKHETEELEQKLAELEASVSKALEEDQPGTAAAELDAASIELGTRAAYQALHQKVVKAQAAKNERRVAELLAKAAKASSSGDFEKAIHRLEEALEASPDHAEALDSLREAKRALEEHREKEKSDAVVRSLIDIQAALEASAFNTARELLDEARAVGVADPAVARQLEALQQRLGSERERQRAVARFRGKIEALVETDELEEAQRVLEEARAEIDRATAFSKLARKIEQLTKKKERQEKEHEHARTCDQIRSLLDTADFSGARLEVAKALRLFPDSPDLERLNEQIEKAEAQAKEKAQAEAADLVDTGQFGKAADLLRESLEADPADAKIRALLESVEATLAEQEEAAKIEEEVAALLVEAEQYESAGRLEAAEQALNGAMALQPDNDKLEELLTKVRTLGEQQRRQREAEQRAGELMKEARGHLKHDRLEEARRAAVEAGELAPSEDTTALLAKIDGRLEQASKQAADRQKAAELAGAARKLVDAGDYQEALTALARARKLDPSSGAVISVIEDKIQKRLAAEPQEDEVAVKAEALVASATDFRDRGDLEQAEKLLMQASQIDTENVEARILLESVRAQLRHRWAELPSTVNAEESRQAEAEARRLAEAKERQRVASESQAEARQDLRPVAAVETGAPETTPASTVTREGSGTLGWRAHWKLLVGVGAGAVVAVGVVLWLTLLRGETPTVAEPVAPQPAPTVTVKEPCILDAVPWAEIVSVVDAEGRKIELGESRFTPVVLALAPGTYQVGMRDPSGKDVRYESIEVIEGRQASISVVFEEVDVDVYFESAGWPQ